MDKGEDEETFEVIKGDICIWKGETKEWIEMKMREEKKKELLSS